MRGLNGKVAVVAGGAGGIGTAICRRLAEEGAEVVCADASLRRGEAVRAELADAGLAIRFAELDVASAASWERLVTSLGTIGVLVSAAYFARGGRFDALSDEDWADNFRVTLDGVFLGMRACAPRMAAGSAIVNVASVAGMVGMPVNAGYGAAKSAVIGLTRTAAVSLAPRGIRVNALSPGFVTTRALDGLGQLMAGDHGGADAARDALLAATPLGRFAAPEDIAASVAFLASDDASFVTGTNLVIDGGFTAQ